MKQTTIFDYILRSSKQLKHQLDIPLQKINNAVLQKDGLIKTYIQKNLSEVIKEQEEFSKIKDLLGNSWFKQENGFGLTDKSNIMILSTLQDFNNNFFNLYKFEDFEQLTQLNQIIKNLKKDDKKLYLILNRIEYNSHYLSKAFEILRENSKVFQHKNLKLLFLRNSKYAALICPKF